MPVPETVQQAMEQVQALKVPSRIAVRDTGQWVEVVDSRFDREGNRG
jgi:hypothetical protein